MKSKPLTLPEGYTIFCVTDKETNEVISAQIINVPAKFVKNKNSESPVISSNILQEDYLSFVSIQVDAFWNYSPVPSYVIRRYDFPIGKDFSLNPILSDLENFKNTFAEFIEQNAISPRAEITLENAIKQEMNKYKPSQLDYGIINENNVLDLLETYKNNLYEVPSILNRFLSNSYFIPQQGDNIISAIKKTNYYQLENICDTQALTEMGRVNMLHLYFARLRCLPLAELQILQDLITFQQQTNEYRDCINIITAYKANEEVIEKLILNSAVEAPKKGNLSPLIDAFKNTDFYINHIQNATPEKFPAFQILLAFNEKYKAESYKKNHNIVSIKEYKDTYNALKENALQNLIVSRLQWVIQRRPVLDEAVRTMLSELNKDILFLNTIAPDNMKLRELYNNITDCLENNKPFPEESKLLSPQIFTFDIRNKKSVTQAIAGFYHKINSEENSIIFATGFENFALDRQAIEYEFLKLNHQCQIEKPVFNATLHYSDNTKIDKEILQMFTKDYMNRLGYSSTPFVVTWDEKKQELSILSLNISRDFKDCHPICTLLNHSNSSAIIAELEQKYNLISHVEIKEETSVQDNISTNLEQKTPEEGAETTTIQDNISTYLDQSTPEENSETTKKQKTKGKKK